MVINLNTSSKTFQYTFALSLLVFAIVLFAAASYSWTGPTGTAPANNVSAPINVGTASQVKTGGLWVASLGTDGGASFGGNVGIGTANPVSGRVQIDADSGEIALRIKTTSAAANTAPAAIQLLNNLGNQIWYLYPDYAGNFRIERGGSPYDIVVTPSGYVGLNHAAAPYRLSIGGGGQNAIFLGNVSYTPSRPTGGALLYGDAGEIRAQDSNGVLTVLSPHNFSLIPNGASEEMAWAFYSQKEESDGLHTINVDMTRAMRLIEGLTGEKLVYLAKDGVDDKSQPEQSLIDDLYTKNADLELQIEALKNELKEIRSTIGGNQ